MMIRPVPPVRPFARIALAVLAGAVLATGCASDSGKSSDSGAPQGGSQDSASSGGAAADPPGKPQDGDAPLAAPPGASESEKQEYALANAVAECMRKAGFTYVAYIAPAGPPQFQDGFERNYDAARAFREKYGFGAFSPAAFPGDPNVSVSATSEDPNTAAFEALPADRKPAYNIALFGNAERSKMPGGQLGGCSGEARKKVYGTQDEIKAKADAASEQARIARQNLNGDAELVRLAQAYATCLRGKGYPVATTSVTEIRNALRFEWFGKAAGLTPQPPEGRPESSEARLDPAVARPQLTKEIQAALADIDCGKDFRAAYFPKLDKSPGAEGLG
ncbi:hypothetical protein [Streptodolium elevatio]|uniref:Uncharacterized protein n=1 Tax=Streptodolium elevatio TaxID=3157996 RepID=A0ABV3DRW8_9ACTN